MVIPLLDDKSGLGMKMSLEDQLFDHGSEVVPSSDQVFD